MSTNVVGMKLHSSGWCGSNRSSSGGSHRLERARDARARSERPGALDREERARVVGVERVAVGVGEHDVRRELADAVGDRDERIAVDLERVVAEVEAARTRRRARPPRARPRRGGSPSRARPSGPAPSRARRTRRARRRRARARAHRRRPAVVTAIAPPARQTKSAECAPITSSLRLTRLRPGVATARRSSRAPRPRRSPASSRRSAQSASPSSTGG